MVDYLCYGYGFATQWLLNYLRVHVASCAPLVKACKPMQGLASAPY